MTCLGHIGLFFLIEWAREHFDLRPKGIVKMLDLLRPIYTKTAATATLVVTN